MKPLYHENVPDQAGIYRIACTITGKFYIGSAINLRNRCYRHFQTLQNNIHKNPKLQAAFNKYGEEAFTFEVVELVLIPELLTAREQYYIDQLQAIKRGFNLAPIAGSTLGVKYSPEGCNNISKAKLGKPNGLRGYKQSPEAIENSRQARIGYKQTEEHKLNAAATRRGAKRSPEAREKIRIANLGHPVSEETRAKIGAKSVGRVASAEKRAKVGKASRERVRTSEEYASRRKKLLAIAPDGTEYIVDGTIKFAKEHGLDSSSIIKVARGKQSHTKGWNIRYLEEG